jgi:hypothetical protein
VSAKDAKGREGRRKQNRLLLPLLLCVPSRPSRIIHSPRYSCGGGGGGRVCRRAGPEGSSPSPRCRLRQSSRLTPSMTLMGPAVGTTRVRSKPARS